jgi:hypothetical protein
MNSPPSRSRFSRAFSVLFFTSACSLAACAPEEADSSPNPIPGAPTFTPDGSTVIVGDAGPTQQPPIGTVDAGQGPFPIPTVDGGRTPVVSADSGMITTVPDAGSTATSDGSVITPDSGATTMRPDQGMGDGKDVVTLGDSWMNLDNSIGIQQSLEKVAKRDYRNFGAPATKLLDEVIPNQYVTAKAQGAIKTVIMTGGGNDVLQDPALLIGECPDATFDTSTACKKRVDDCIARLSRLWADMAKDGVQDVIIIGYTEKAVALLGPFTKVNAYTDQKSQPACNMVPAPLRCTVFDTDILVPDLTLGFDSIHPDAAGYDKIGAAVWKIMQEKGMRR